MKTSLGCNRICPLDPSLKIRGDDIKLRFYGLLVIRKGSSHPSWICCLLNFESATVPVQANCWVIVDTCRPIYLPFRAFSCSIKLSFPRRGRYTKGKAVVTIGLIIVERIVFSKTISYDRSLLGAD